ncbi:hypothetical protein [Humisphaera borealis]|uniref:DUF4190 domain-containing protein n=1 Tax=Humisphaera borealis TaxID=2807512 RepID=A0A7M2WTR7_9BACT|nr:hypothetical protein [Humisphaera borealis]QOV88664.1 hypothetical protein IPV69_20860 [Humisphaera borealis]
MSTTAGLGSGDYAAVNTLAVVAFVGSLLGCLALLADLLVVIPVAAVVCAVIALRQIAASNGTQAGRWAGILAIVIGVGVVGILVGSRIYVSVQNKPDQQQVLSIISEFDKRIGGRDYAGAYQLTTPQFRSRVSEQSFVQKMLQFEANADTGGVAGVTWNGTPIEYQDDPQSSLKTAWVGTVFRYRTTLPPNRIPVSFARQDGKWGINDIPALFK